MLASLDQIIDRIVTDYDPERIILFGSHASGKARDGSDIDLLIVKETLSRPADRRLDLERLLSDRSIALDLLVYTPRELWRLYANGSPFIEDVMESGRILYMRKVTQSWIGEAREDLESASILLKHEKFRGACFHSQQCVEKALKAVILEKGRRPARTHDLVELLKAVSAEGAQIILDMDDVAFLNSIYHSRYPTEAGLLPQGEPHDDDARRALRAAEKAMDQVFALITPPQSV
jgi:HEPN domain-containing protein/predicted nucleotidyltransferase